MGWWGYGVLDGDEPYDIIAEIEDVVYEGIDVDRDEQFLLCFDDFSEDHKQKIRENFNSRLEQILAKVSDNYDEVIAMQVVGSICMMIGTNMSDERRKVYIQAAEDDDADTFRDPSERRKALNDFITQLKSYDGNPIEVAHQGLFEVMDQHLAEGKSGLINK